MLIINCFRIPAHKIVLSTATEYFSVMFESDLKKKQTTIKITGVRGETLKDIVNYIYTGTICENIIINNYFTNIRCM